MKQRIILSLVLCFCWLGAAGQKTDTLFLYFGNAEYELSPAHKPALDSIAAAAKKNQVRELRIYGYTDQTGKLTDNKDLSVRRAKTVRHYFFEKHKINRALLKDFRGAGPVKTDANAGQNISEARHRRVEVIITRPSAQADLGNLSAGSSMAIQKLDFIPGRHVITPESQPALDNLLLVMQQNPTMKIEIQGHICCQTGTDGYDSDTKKYELSANRAKFVYNFLMQNGIGANRLSYRGFGRTKPLANPELTDEDRQKNRRVEIKIVSR